MLRQFRLLCERRKMKGLLHQNDNELIIVYSAALLPFDPSRSTSKEANRPRQISPHTGKKPWDIKTPPVFSVFSPSRLASNGRRSNKRYFCGPRQKLLLHLVSDFAVSPELGENLTFFLHIISSCILVMVRSLCVRSARQSHVHQVAL